MLAHFFKKKIVVLKPYNATEQNKSWGYYAQIYKWMAENLLPGVDVLKTFLGEFSLNYQIEFCNDVWTCTKLLKQCNFNQNYGQKLFIAI